MARTQKKLTVAEQRELLEKQMADLEILELVEEEIKGLAKKYRDYFNGECTMTYEDGLEDEQAKNYDGELLYIWKDADGYSVTGTLEKAEKLGVKNEDMKPYFRKKYREETKPIDELSSWAKTRALAYKRLAEFFENTDVTQIGE